MTDNLIKAHHDKMQDKENRQKVSNKTNSISQGKNEAIPGLKKNRTSEGGFSRQSAVHQNTNYVKRNSQKPMHQITNEVSSNHHISKHSEE